MQNRIADGIVAVVDRTSERLAAIEPEKARRRPAPGKWSVQEIIGHLIDSACNNHHRFVRTQEPDALAFPGYAQDHWVATQAYNDAPLADVLALWRTYNHHLARVIRHLPDARLDTRCVIGGAKPVTLGFLVEDYLDHMNHHLKRVDEMLDAR